jgi:hypothetical protein
MTVEQITNKFISHMNQFKAFWKKVCQYGMCVQNLCPSIWPKTRWRSGQFTAALFEKSMSEVDILSRLLWGQIVGLCLWSWDETSVIQMAQQHVKLKEKVVGYKILRKNLADWFLFWQHVCGALSVLLKDRQLIPVFMSEVLSIWGMPFSRIMPDNVLFYASLTLQHFLVKNQIPSISWPLYSPYLTACYFHFFLRLKIGLKVHPFVSVKEMQQNVTAGVTFIPKYNFQGCFQQWQDCWSKCVCAERQYFKGD